MSHLFAPLSNDGNAACHVLDGCRCPCASSSSISLTAYVAISAYRLCVSLCVPFVMRHILTPCAPPSSECSQCVIPACDQCLCNSTRLYTDVDCTRLAGPFGIAPIVAGAPSNTRSLNFRYNRLQVIPAVFSTLVNLTSMYVCACRMLIRSSVFLVM